MSEKNISKEYIELMELSDNDETFIIISHMIPFSFLEDFVPKDYLLKTFDYLNKKGKLNDKHN